MFDSGQWSVPARNHNMWTVLTRLSLSHHLLPHNHKMFPRKQSVCRAALLTLILTTFLTFLSFDPGGERGEGGRGGGGEESQGPGWVRNIRVKTILMPKKCEEGEVVVIVHSHAENAEMRSSQRRAVEINKKNQNLKFVFVLFHSEGSERRVEQEHELHGDILLGDMEESYHHLIYKHMTGLRWARDHCPDNTLIKMDDDIYVNFPSLLGLVPPNIPPSAEGRWMMGLLQVSLPVVRTNTSKWSVSSSDWSQDQYPDFLSGWAYLASPLSVRLVVEVLDSQQNVFWIDDVMVTGVVAPSVGITLTSLNSYFTVFQAELDCCQAREKGVRCGYLVGPTGSSPALVTGLAVREEQCWRETCRADLLPCPRHLNLTARGEVLSI